MVHTTAGYMVYTAYTFQNVFNYEENDIFWCTADIGWITGHSYILYGPLLNGATTVIFEGVPSYPDFSRFWEIIEKHKVNQFYTAPTAIRALAKESLDYIQKFPIPFITPTKPTYATLPLPGIQAVLMDEKRNEIEDNQVVGSLCIKYPWPGIARTIWGDHQRYKDTYFSAFPGKYFSGDGAYRSCR